MRTLLFFGHLKLLLNSSSTLTPLRPFVGTKVPSVDIYQNFGWKVKQMKRYNCCNGGRFFSIKLQLLMID
jgi:hypothetical protein